MQKLITLIFLLIVNSAYSQTKQRDSVLVATADVQAGNEAFDDLDSCEYFSAMKDAALEGQQNSIRQRDRLIAQKETDFNLLLSQKGDVDQSLADCTQKNVLSENNFTALKKKNTKKLAGGITGSILAGIAIGIVAGIFIPRN